MGARVRELREKAELTQQELAFRSGLSVGAISKLEQAEEPDPRLSTLRHLAQGLNMTLPNLVAELVRKEKKK